MGNEIEITEEDKVWTALAWHIYKNEIPPEDWEIEKIEWCSKHKVSLPSNKILKRLLSEFDKEFKDERNEEEKVKKPSYVLYLESKGIKYFNYITYATNLVSILKNGILSRNIVEQRELSHKDVSFESVQKWRIENFEDIHDYVPLYFATHTPMLYRLYKTDKGKFIIILKVDLKIFRERAFFTNINVACKEFCEGKHLFTEEKDLEKLRWDIINEPRCWSDEYKRYKSAELLIKDKVAPSYFRKIIFSNENTMKTYKDILKWEIKKYKAYNLRRFLNMMKVDKTEFPII